MPIYVKICLDSKISSTYEYKLTLLHQRNKKKVMGGNYKGVNAVNRFHE
jgi:hypothetical protein